MCSFTVHAYRIFKILFLCFKNSFWRTYFSTISGFNYRNHRKIIVIDKYIGYVGGFNIGNWLDSYQRTEKAEKKL